MQLFAEMLDAHLRCTGMSRAEFAKEACCDLSLVSLYLRGKRAPPLNKLLRYCKVLNCTPNELLGYHGPDKTHGLLVKENRELKYKLEKIKEVFTVH